MNSHSVRNIGFHINTQLCENSVLISDGDLVKQVRAVADITENNFHHILQKLKIDYIVLFNNSAKKYFGKLCYMEKYFQGDNEKEVKKQLIKYHIDVLAETKKIIQKNKLVFFRPNKRGL